MLSIEYRNKFKQTVLNYIGNQEIWAFHPKYNRYLISNTGKVKNIITGKISKATPNKSHGYISVTLISNENKREINMVHRLVAETFLAYLNNNFYEVNHIDCNKSNNTLENLEWTTRRENIKHAVKNKRFLSRKGEKSPSCKFTDKDILIMREMKNNKIKLKDIAKKFNTSITYVCTLINKGR